MFSTDAIQILVTVSVEVSIEVLVDVLVEVLVQVLVEQGDSSRTGWSSFHPRHPNLTSSRHTLCHLFTSTFHISLPHPTSGLV